MLYREGLDPKCNLRWHSAVLPACISLISGKATMIHTSSAVVLATAVPETGWGHEWLGQQHVRLRTLSSSMWLVLCFLFELRHVVGPTEQRSGRGGPVPCWEVLYEAERKQTKHSFYAGPVIHSLSVLPYFVLVLIYSTVGTWLFEESFCTKHTAHITRQHRNDQRTAGGLWEGEHTMRAFTAH